MRPNHRIRPQHALRIHFDLHRRVADPEVVLQIVRQRMNERVSGVARKDH